MKRFATMIVLLLALFAGSGCTDGEVSVNTALSVDEEGALTERITVEGLPSGTQIDEGLAEAGWAVESTSSPLVVTRKYTNVSEVATAESALVQTILGAIEMPLGYRPEIVSEPWASVKVQDFKLATRYLVNYSPPIIDFEPPYCVDCQGAGDGACASCEGDGAIACPSCGGARSAQCAACVGKGYLVCDTCESQGFDVCTSCDGKGDSDCWSCDAVGWTECYRCDGTGIYEDWWSGAQSQCTACGGDGRDSCDSCDGTGKRECSSCDGDGKHECSSCDGDGRRECATCEERGQVDCPNCQALGALDCRACAGVGESACGSCDGSGEAPQAQLASYESGLKGARVAFSVDMPGMQRPGQGAKQSWDYSGAGMKDSEVMTLESWIPNWPTLGSSIAALIALLAGAGWYGWRKLATAMRRPGVSAAPLDGAVPEAGTASIAEAGSGPQRFCVGCGAPLRFTAEFCSTCGSQAASSAAGSDTGDGVKT